MKTQIITIILSIAASVIADAQSTIKGSVIDNQGEPVIGANVYLENSFDGTSTDHEGLFSFETDLSGVQVLIISFIGYEESKNEIDLESPVPQLKIKLVEAINKIDGIVITAGSFEAGGEHKREVLKELDIVTTAGTSADIAGALNTLPGTQTVGEEGRLFVRGGSGHEAKTFIDGLLALEPYHTTVPKTPTRNRFSPFLFSGTSFSTGGYSAEYGQALSSALILTTKEKDMQNRADFSLLNLGMEAGYSYANEATSVVGNVGYFNMKPYFSIVPQNIDWTKEPESVEVNLVLRQNIGKTGRFKFYSNYLKSTSQLMNYSIEDPQSGSPMDINNNYLYLNSSFRTSAGKTWSTFVGASYTGNQNRYQIAGSPIDEDHHGYHTKLSFAGPVGNNLELNTGIEYFRRAYSYTGTYQNLDFDLPFNEPLLSMFIESDWYVSNKLLARAGLRAEKSWLNNSFRLSPRLSLAYKTGEKSQVSFAFGQFSQASENEVLRIKPELAYEKANHYILNYQWMLEKRTFRIEAFYKQYNNLVKYSGDGFDPSSYTNLGFGVARGIDVFWRDNKSLKNVDYWVSYSFLDTERDYKNYPGLYMPEYASRHNLSVVYKQFILPIRTQIGGTYSYGSPRPFNDKNVPEFNSGKTPHYHDLSLSLSHLLLPNLIIYGSMTNILGRKNVFGYEYGTTPMEDGMYNSRPIILPSKHFYILGIFYTISKGGTLNQMKSL